jgi:hypothetical protein
LLLPPSKKLRLQELGLLDVSAQGELPDTDSYPAKTVSIDGSVDSLATVDRDVLGPDIAGIAICRRDTTS